MREKQLICGQLQLLLHVLCQPLYQETYYSFRILTFEEITKATAEGCFAQQDRAIGTICLKLSSDLNTVSLKKKVILKQHFGTSHCYTFCV